jgi:hypothetical protein
MSETQSYFLIIKMENGSPKNHPMLLENFVQCFPDVDINNLPDEYKFFERVDKPPVGLYEVLDPPDPVYTLIDNVVTDVWTVRAMTPEEKQAKMDSVLAVQIHTGWIFSEETCAWEPPIPYPEDGKKYVWNDATVNWEEIPPQDEEVLP